jgi:hypothetical protein
LGAVDRVGTGSEALITKIIQYIRSIITAKFKKTPINVRSIKPHTEASKMIDLTFPYCGGAAAA